MSYYETVEDIEESEGEEVDEESEVEEEIVPKRRKHKKWKDPNKPKRAMSAFFCYSQAERPNVKLNHPDASFGDVARILSAQYKALSEKEMKKWVKKAEQDKIRYQEEMKHYVPMDDPTGGKRKKAKKRSKCTQKKYECLLPVLGSHSSNSQGRKSRCCLW